MKKAWLAPLWAVVGGGVGFGLRKWQLATGFEPANGLAIPGATASTVLMIWSAVVILGLIALCWGRKGPRTREMAFRAKGNSLFLTACVLGAFLLLVSAAAEAVTLSAGYQLSQYANSSGMSLLTARFLPPLRVALCLGGFPCALLWVRQVSREGEGRRESLPLLELCLLFCLWLISDYQVRAADPVTQDYVYEVFAIAAAVMALYYLAGYSFQTGKPRRTVVTCLGAAYFSLVTLADGHGLSDATRFGFVVLFMTAHAALILSGPNEAEPVADADEEPHEAQFTQDREALCRALEKMTREDFLKFVEQSLDAFYALPEDEREQEMTFLENYYDEHFGGQDHE